MIKWMSIPHLNVDNKSLAFLVAMGNGQIVIVYCVNLENCIQIMSIITTLFDLIFHRLLLFWSWWWSSSICLPLIDYLSIPHTHTNSRWLLNRQAHGDQISSNWTVIDVRYGTFSCWLTPITCIVHFVVPCCRFIHPFNNLIN